ncbi:MAG: hypothetical protein AVDCRST_MAG22-3240, partial [uncultured Rubrobacteraceae bacterium]
EQPDHPGDGCYRQDRRRRRLAVAPPGRPGSSARAYPRRPQQAAARSRRRGRHRRHVRPAAGRGRAGRGLPPVLPAALAPVHGAERRGLRHGGQKGGRRGHRRPLAVAGEPVAPVAGDPPELLVDRLFGMVPDAAHVSVAPPFFADNYLGNGL